MIHRGGCTKNPAARDYVQAPEVVIMMRGKNVAGCRTRNPMPGLRGRRTPRLAPDEGA
ncbi:hypothetical protein ABZ845_31425 [Streptomyces sp. NPDC047022]|uniref:hypothetical protein n=1 Tax=Streptomyces sp. NPDC047022 TaxID=3155737 RepID=UPI00340958DF